MMQSVFLASFLDKNSTLKAEKVKKFLDCLKADELVLGPKFKISNLSAIQNSLSEAAGTIAKVLSLLVPAGSRVRTRAGKHDPPVLVTVAEILEDFSASRDVKLRLLDETEGVQEAPGDSLVIDFSKLHAVLGSLKTALSSQDSVEVSSESIISDVLTLISKQYSDALQLIPAEEHSGESSTMANRHTRLEDLPVEPDDDYMSYLPHLARLDLEQQKRNSGLNQSTPALGDDSMFDVSLPSFMRQNAEDTDTPTTGRNRMFMQDEARALPLSKDGRGLTAAGSRVSGVDTQKSGSSKCRYYTDIVDVEKHERFRETARRQVAAARAQREANQLLLSNLGQDTNEYSSGREEHQQETQEEIEHMLARAAQIQKLLVQHKTDMGFTDSSGKSEPSLNVGLYEPRVGKELLAGSGAEQNGRQGNLQISTELQKLLLGRIERRGWNCTA